MRLSIVQVDVSTKLNNHRDPGMDRALQVVANDRLNCHKTGTEQPTTVLIFALCTFYRSPFSSEIIKWQPLNNQIKVIKIFCKLHVYSE